MKKFYTEPEFELVNIRLVADVLGASDETPHPGYGEEVGGDDEFDDEW